MDELDQAFNSLSVIQARIARVSDTLARRSSGPSRVPFAVAAPVPSSVSTASSVVPLALAPDGSIARGDRVRIK